MCDKNVTDIVCPMCATPKAPSHFLDSRGYPTKLCDTCRQLNTNYRRSRAAIPEVREKNRERALRHWNKVAAKVAAERWANMSDYEREFRLAHPNHHGRVPSPDAAIKRRERRREYTKKVVLIMDTCLKCGHTKEVSEFRDESGHRYRFCSDCRGGRKP